MNAKKSYRKHERDYIAELDSIQRGIEFLLDFIDGSPDHRIDPVVEDLEAKESFIKRALRRPVLPPLPYKLRNPFTRLRSPVKAECIRKLVKKYR